MKDDWRAIIETGDGQEVDIRADLAKLYDLVVGSMDWGSGFLDDEDRETVVKIGVLCGFEIPACKRWVSTTLTAYEDRRKNGASEEQVQERSKRGLYGYDCKRPVLHDGEHGMER